MATRGNAVDEGFGSSVTRSTLITSKEERSVAAVVEFRENDRASQVNAEVVQLVLRDDVAKCVGGIEVGVLNVLERPAMEVIGAGLGNRGDVGDAAKLSRIQVFADLDFLDGVEGREHFS